MKSIFLYIFVFFGVNLALSQVVELPIYVQNEKGENVYNALVYCAYQSASYINNKKGSLTIRVTNDSNTIYVSSEGYYPFITQLDLEQDSILIRLKKYMKSDYSDSAKLLGGTLMKKVINKGHYKKVNYQAKILEHRIFELENVPINVAGVSGRLFPSFEDTGRVLTSLRLSDFSYLNSEISYENILAKVDSGLFKELGEIGLKRVMINLYDEKIYLYPFSNLLFHSPAGKDSELYYDFYLQDSISFNDRVFYRVESVPKDEYEPLFHSTLWVFKDDFVLYEAHLKAYHENQLDFIDSIGLHFYTQFVDDHMVPMVQQVNGTMSILNFDFDLHINSILLNFNDSVQLDSLRDERLEIYKPRTKNDIDILMPYTQYITGGENPFDDPNLSQGLSAKQYTEKGFIQKQVNLARAIFVTGNEYKFKRGYVSIYPFLLSAGYNTVEGYFFNLRSTYYQNTSSYNFKVTPWLRYGFSSKRWYPKIEAELSFNYEDPVKVILEGGSYISQFNRLSPIDPFVNSLYSLGIEKNYMKIYQREYAKFLVDKELFRGLEFVFSFEVAKRTALFNQSFESILGDGSKFTANNPEFPPIISSEEGFDTHFANILRLEMYYQFGRKYTFENNKLKKVKSSLPRLFLIYQTGLSYAAEMPDYNFLAGGVGSKTHIRDLGVFEFDLSVGGFGKKELIHFPDFKHFNGVQTAFINRTWDGWTDVRQFSTLPYYDYSTDRFFTEFHAKHRFLGSLLSRSNKLKPYQLHSYAGYNFLYTDNVGVYNEIYVGVENLLRIFNLQLAMGINNNADIRIGFLVGINFNYTFYVDTRNR